MAMVKPQIISHRGGAYLWPENSLLAFRQSLTLPVEVLECDVHPSSDGVPMVHHDATLERMTDLAGPLVARSAAELGKARFRGAPGETIPSLAALARLVAPSDKLLRVEVKGDRDHKPYPDFLPRVLAVLEAEGMLARSVIIAFHGGTAAAAAQRGRGRSSDRTRTTITSSMMGTATSSPTNPPKTDLEVSLSSIDSATESTMLRRASRTVRPCTASIRCKGWRPK